MEAFYVAIQSLAVLFSNTVYRSGDVLNLYPIMKTKTEGKDEVKFVAKTGSALYLHYLTLGLGFLISMEKVRACAELVLSHEYEAIEKVLGISILAVHFSGWLFSLGVILRPDETADLLNSWSSVSKILTGETGEGRKVSPFTSVGASGRYIIVVIVTTWIAFVVGGISLFLAPIPVTWVHFARPALHSVPKDYMHSIYIKLVFFPLEMAVSLPLMVSSAFSVGTVILGIGLQKKFADAIRC